MEYVVPDEKYGSGFGRYSFDYQSLKQDFERYKKMSDVEFIANLPKVLHYASFICYVKNLPSSQVHIDNGIMHELIHLLNGDSEAGRNIRKIRKMFVKQLSLT